MPVEIVPAVLRRMYEGIEDDWNKVVDSADHIQIDITDGVFAGDGTYRELRRFKQLPRSEKIELHMMVHAPDFFVDDIIDLAPARCVFHIESFAGGKPIEFAYQKIRDASQTELGLAINPDSPNERLEEHLGLVDYVLFMGYDPGFAGQDINPAVYRKIGSFRDAHPDMPIAVDGHVDKTTIPDYVHAGARMLAANSSIFGSGDPKENYRQLQLLAEAELS